MIKEAFKDTLEKKYIEDIQDAYRRCERNGGKLVDHTRLMSLLTNLEKKAIADGLTTGEFEDLTRCALPGLKEFSQGKKVA